MSKRRKSQTPSKGYPTINHNILKGKSGIESTREVITSNIKLLIINKTNVSAFSTTHRDASTGFNTNR